MRAVKGRSDRINAIWDAGIFVGPTRAHARVTIQRCTQKTYHFRTRNYRTINFEQSDPPRELPNVKAIQINRATDQDAATCTITFFNTKPLPVGTLPENQKDIDAEGWFTFSRGTGRTPVGGYSINEWKNWLREDRILRTYQGYGINPKVPATEDENLIQTGTWLIDEVEINSAGDIVAICRDLAAFLIDQVVYPPVVPGKPYLEPGQIEQYPLFFEKRHNETTIIPSMEITVSAGGSSNDAYTSGAVYGHDDYMAFDSSLSTYWLSIGNAKPSEDWSYEWIQANVHGSNTISLRFTPWKGNYTVYVSVRIGGVWQGSNTIPYNPDAGPAAPNGSNIKYVRKVTCGYEQSMSIPIDYNNVEYVRLTFTDLADSDLGSYQYRAGVRNFDVFAEPVPEVKVVGDFNDYCADEQTEILTRRGWLRWDEVTEGDEALAMDPVTGVGDWQVIESIYRKHRDRNMISMESLLHSSLTTPNHRWLVTDQKGQRSWRTTETLRTGHRIPLAMPVVAPLQEKWSTEFVELVAWFWTEGWGLDRSAALAQSEVANPVHTARIRSALTALYGTEGGLRSGGLWREWRRADGVVTFCLHKSVRDQLLEVMSTDKVVTAEFLTSLTEAQLALFIERSLDADGWRTTRGRIGLSQRSEARAKAFEMACVLAGRPVRTRLDHNGMWSVNLLRHAVTMPQSAKVETVRYQGVVWCPTLKHHNWVARRNGTVYVTGNTDLVKQLCAMGGFYWPRGAYPLAPNRDPVLGDDVTGRAWGDFETAGTGPVVDIPETVWDKKSLMDGITYVKEILGFIFFVDEVGGAVFRSPNIWRVGNFTTDVQNSIDRHRVGGVPILVLHEDRHLISYSVRLSNRNKRRSITVGTKDGRISATVPGDDTIPASEFPLLMERYAIYTDQNFASKTECLVMGELIKIRANFTFRRGSVNIKANPNIQPDDQVRIIERRTGESFLHYVAGISSTWEAATGRYDMELSTFWLGEAASQAPPGGSVVDVTQFSTATQDYLRRIGKI